MSLAWEDPTDLRIEQQLRYQLRKEERILLKVRDLVAAGRPVAPTLVEVCQRVMTGRQERRKRRRE